MFRRKLLLLAATGAMVALVPLNAMAYSGATFTYTPSNTTHSGWSSVTSVGTSNPAKTTKSTETVLAYDEQICHHSDATCSPADGTTIGTAAATAHFFPFCTLSTQNFNVKWINPDGGYTPPTGWSVVSEVQITSSLATFDGYAIWDGASPGHYKLEVPSYPSLTCTSSSYADARVTLTIGTAGGTSYNVHKNPSTSGTFTVTQKITYTDNTTESPTASFSQ